MMKLDKKYFRRLAGISVGLAVLLFGAQPTHAVSNLTPSKPVVAAPLKAGAALDAATKYPQAILSFSKVIKSKPDDSKAYYWRGLSYFHNAEYSKAVEDLSESIRLDKSNQDARLIRGTAYLENKQADKAIEDLQWVTEKDPQFKEAFQRLSTAYEQIDKKDMASLVKKQASKMHYRSWVAEGEPSTPLEFSFDKNLYKQIKWKPPDRSGFMVVTIGFIAHRNQTLSDVRIKETSNDIILDKLALETIRKVKKAGPLPPGSPEFIQDEFTGTSLPFANAGFLSFKDLIQVLRVEGPARLQMKGNFLGAANLYKQALENFNSARPEIHIAKLIPAIAQNLGDCYWHVSLSLRTDPKEQMQYLHQALFYRPHYEQYETDLDDAICQIGKDPQSVTDRLALADEAVAINDRKSAIVEYRAALKLKEDLIVQGKLRSLEVETPITGLSLAGKKK